MPGVGSAVRPNRMRAAFESIGYQVDDVSGYGDERKAKIAKIKENIKNGVVYDFVYSESENSPTLLTEEDHIPRHPALDFSFFAYCQKHGIPVGLFYRDMHWRFPLYKKAVSAAKRAILIPLFHYDLYQYRRCLSRIYLPCVQLHEFIPKGLAYDALPPGGVAQKELLERRRLHTGEAGTLRVFYVGNVAGDIYNLETFCRAVKETPGVYLTICTQEDTWKSAFEQYRNVMCDRIRVIHKKSHELTPYYEEADVFSCCLGANSYISRAMPIKVFEAIGYGIPLMITESIAAAAVVREEDCGWCIPDQVEQIKQTLSFLRDNPEEIAAKTANAIAAVPRHTWKARAQKVADDLTNIK